MLSLKRSEAAPRLDSESQAWLDALHADDVRREAAIARLHALLLRATRYEVARRRATMPQVGGAELEDIAQQSADDALVAILGKLDGFRGESRFSTWAYKFALLEAAVKLRRRRWLGREVCVEPERWPDLGDGGVSSHEQVERAELLAAVRRAIDEDLSAHQREVLVAVALNGVPIDVLAERLGTTRGALYKTIHDARARLRRVIEAAGLSVEPGVTGEQR